ncbi:MAG: hypothetical protein FJ295_08450 [Planctomycetes bacterium]|nr:hypothetical protein [Planctomycetota bacterium]
MSPPHCRTGNGERGTGNGERGTGTGERGTGNGERGTGNVLLSPSFVQPMRSPDSTTIDRHIHKD